MYQYKYSQNDIKHTVYTIVPWLNLLQWLIRTSDLMMISRIMKENALNVME